MTQAVGPVTNDNATLAVDGGVPVRAEPFAPWPHFSEAEIAAVETVLRTGRVNYWTGEHGRAFECEFAEFAACNYAVAVANGTVALEAALRAVGVGPGDEVVVTPRTFIASASAVVMVGATPVFADVDPVSQNITAESVRSVLSPRTRAVIAVHLAGWPCDMDPIMALADERDLKVIEDCAQSHGACYKGRPTGSLGHVAAFSFCQDKIMTTGGEGGMVTTNDENIWRAVWAFKDHGKDFDTVFHRQHPPGFRWLHESFGTNWRMTEMQAAIGRSVLARLPAWIDTRQAHAAALNAACADEAALRVTVPPADLVHAYYKHYVFVRPEALRPGWSRDRIMQAIVAEGVPCFSGSCSEIYLERAFGNGGTRPKERLRVVRQLGEEALMFLVHPTLSEGDIADTCAAVRKVLRAATRNGQA